MSSSDGGGRAPNVTADSTATHGHGWISVPNWVVTALVLALMFLGALTAYVLVPDAQRPYLEPPTPTGPAAPHPTTSAPTATISLRGI